MSDNQKGFNEQQQQDLLRILEQRFQNNRVRHPTVEWAKVQIKLMNQPQKLWSLQEMEQTGGEPDVVQLDPETDGYQFCDCSPESPIGRRSLCFDAEALQSRKKDKPLHSALGMAAEMGIEVLTEEQYRRLQAFGQFDTKTSSWIQTPAEIRTLGGALFCDRRYHQVFVYHNGAESYYSSRGFRGFLRV